MAAAAPPTKSKIKRNFALGDLRRGGERWFSGLPGVGTCDEGNSGDSVSKALIGAFSGYGAARLRSTGLLSPLPVMESKWIRAARGRQGHTI
jgi:hypothetical protein